MTTQSTVTRELVPDDQRLAITEKLFGVHFQLQLEPVIYGISERMAEDYTGGYWDFYSLSNGGFYAGPSGDRFYHVICDNCFEGDLSADALGITCCLYAYSHLSFTDGDIVREYAHHHHRLRAFMVEHPEVGAILGATTDSPDVLDVFDANPVTRDAWGVWEGDGRVGSFRGFHPPPADPKHLGEISSRECPVPDRIREYRNFSYKFSVKKQGTTRIRHSLYYRVHPSCSVSVRSRILVQPPAQLRIST